MTRRQRIFFVDDDQHVIDGLQHALLDKRSTWDMEFFDTVVAALDAYRAHPADAVPNGRREEPEKTVRHARADCGNRRVACNRVSRSGLREN